MKEDAELYAELYTQFTTNDVMQIPRNRDPLPVYQASRFVHFLFSFLVVFVLLGQDKDPGIHAQLQDKENGNEHLRSTPLLGASRQIEHLRWNGTTQNSTRSLLLLRHAKSSFDFPSLTNDQRPLAERGVKAAKRLGYYLKENRIPPPEIIFVSPSVRTRATMDLVRKQWAADVPVIHDPRLYNLTFRGYFDLVRHLDSQYLRVLLVGHNPAMHSLARQLVSDPELAEKFSTGAILEIQLEGVSAWKTTKEGKGTGVLFVSPKSVKQ
jgi:phosphohistidine phosphatase